MGVPGTPYRAEVRRQPHAGGSPIKVLDLRLRAPHGVLFQPHREAVFMASQGNAVIKQDRCFADWPAGVFDPYPVHPGDLLIIYLPRPLVTEVVDTPTPTITTFRVTAGTGHRLLYGADVTVGRQTGRIGFVADDVVTLLTANQLTTVPAVGDVVRQDSISVTVEDADPYMGQSIEIYTRLVPHNA